MASDSDGSIVSYLWEQVSGMSVTLNNATSSQADFDIPTIIGVTNLVFSLTVTDNQGATDTDEVLIILE
jgi:chitinase